MQFDLEIYKIDMFIVNMIQSIFFIDHNRHNNFVPCLFYLFTLKKKISVVSGGRQYHSSRSFWHG